MRLHETIKQFYFDNLDKLPEDKQFHYASRLASWDGDARAYSILKKLEPWMVGKEDDGIKTVLSSFIEEKPKSSLNAYHLRKPFFDKYTPLYGVHSALFRVRHLKSVYGVDVSDTLFECISKQDLDGLSSALVTDDEAVRNLSTFAVNFLYLYKAVLSDESEFINLQHFVDVSHAYDLSDKKQLQLSIYLFTHCIIGETNFYIKKVEPRRLDNCTKLLKILEPIIDKHFLEINLDNKLEFLVCCRICGFDSPLFENVFNECERSLSDKGHFLIDKHNKNAQRNRADFIKAEHRNVLYLMSVSTYNPRPTLIA